MIVLDIRTNQEYKARHICDAINVHTPRPPLPLHARQALMDKLVKLNLPDGETITVYCAQGIRSKLAAGLLRQLGHPVIDLGGIDDEANFQRHFPHKLCTTNYSAK